MNTQIKIFSMAAVILSVTACVNHHRIEGNHRVETDNRKTETFTAIESNGDIDVFVEYDTVTSIEVEAEANILPYINTSVNKDKLVIEEQSHLSLRTHYPIRVYVKSPYVHEAILNGSGSLEVSGMDVLNFYAELKGSGNMQLDILADLVDADINGSGDINMIGTTKDADFYINGSGDISAYALTVENCFVTVNGSGNIYTTVKNNMDVKINGSGNVYYAGSPRMSVSMNGSGKIINKN